METNFIGFVLVCESAIQSQRLSKRIEFLFLTPFRLLTLLLSIICLLTYKTSCQKNQSLLWEL